MKKFWSYALAGALIVSLSACQGTGAGQSEAAPSGETPQSAPKEDKAATSTNDAAPTYTAEQDKLLGKPVPVSYLGVSLRLPKEWEYQYDLEMVKLWFAKDLQKPSSWIELTSSFVKPLEDGWAENLETFAEGLPPVIKSVLPAAQWKLSEIEPFEASWGASGSRVHAESISGETAGLLYEFYFIPEPGSENLDEWAAREVIVAQCTYGADQAATMRDLCDQSISSVRPLGPNNPAPSTSSKFSPAEISAALAAPVTHQFDKPDAEKLEGVDHLQLSMRPPAGWKQQDGASELSDLLALKFVGNANSSRPPSITVERQGTGRSVSMLDSARSGFTAGEEAYGAANVERIEVRSFVTDSGWNGLKYAFAYEEKQKSGEYVRVREIHYILPHIQQVQEDGYSAYGWELVPTCKISEADAEIVGPICDMSVATLAVTTPYKVREAQP